jgi:hypothetical protein
MPYSPAMTARNRPSLGFSLATLVLCLPALVACGSEEGSNFQRVAFCQGASSAIHDDGFLDVEFRQGTKVVAANSASVGTVISAEVPIGGIQIYVDGVKVGSVNEGVSTEDPWVEPGPNDATYMAAGEGCPAKPFP